MLEHIKSTNLRKTILRALNKKDFEEVSSEDLLTIENILLDATDFNSNSEKININDIDHFPNLKSVTLQHFLIDDKSIESLDEQLSLSTISFVNCIFDCRQAAILGKYPKIIKFIGCTNLPHRLSGIKKLYIEQCGIDFDSIDFSSLEYLKIGYSKIRNVHDLDEKCRTQEIEVLNSTLLDKNGNEVETIKVPTGTKFSNEKINSDYYDNRDR